jgi:phosphonate transport system substrate-binding protein
LKRLRVALLALACLPVIGAGVPSSTLRVAAVTGAAGACAAPAASLPAGERAYYDHLAKRLEVKVLRCPVADATAAARALAANELDLAVLDPAAFAAVQATTRSILTVRSQGGVNRIPVVLGVKATSPVKTLADLRGKSLVFGGRTPAALSLPKLALSQRDAPAAFWGRELFAVDGDAAVSDLRANKADAMVLHAAAWQRLCFPRSPKEAPPCDDLRIIAKIRPQADRAIVVRRDIADETRYRLIGIHMPMHLENAPAFAWATSWSPNAAEFQPAEPLALVATR